MPLIPYTKPSLSYQDQINLLSGRGLHFKNIKKAEYLLKRISYYRLSAYWYPFFIEDSTNGITKSWHYFRYNSKFDTAFKLYAFDRELRQLIASELEKIEVALRTQLIYVLSHAYGAFWYTDPLLFQNSVKHTNTISTLTREFSKSNEQFIKSYKAKYSNPLPPSWMMLEITSFGSLSTIYSNLRNIPEKTEIANFFNTTSKKLASWLHSLTYVRNICAHHSRLWNIDIRVTSPKSNSLPQTWLNDRSFNIDKVYYYLSLILYLLQTVNKKNNFSFKLNSLFAKYPNVDPAALGFTPNWKKEELWKLRIFQKIKVALISYYHYIVFKFQKI